MSRIAIAGTMEIDLDVIARIASEQLGMVPGNPSMPMPPLDPFEATPTRWPDLDGAISAVVQASDRVDRDQYTGGEQAALASLFRAAKQLRAVTRQMKSLTPKPKGKVHV